MLQNMKDENPLVSVIIPTYYRNTELQRAIESALRQTYSPIEIIVVDGSGEGHARSAVQNYNIHYIPQDEDRGANGARNRGIQEAKGRYVQLLDDDDEILPNKLASQVELLESSPAEVAYGGIKTREGGARLPSEESTGDSLKAALQFNWWTAITSSLLLSKNILLEIYPLSDDLGDDVGMRIELAKRSDFVFVDEVLTVIHDTENNKSSRKSFMNEREAVIRYYSDLYDQYPQSIRNSALGYAYRKKAFVILEHEEWSLSATKFFLLSLYYTPGIDLRLIVAILLSLFGLRGVRFGEKVDRTLRQRS